MAEILAGAIPISGGATVTSKIKRIFKSGSSPTAASALNADSSFIFHVGSVTSATSALNVGFSVRIKYGRANVQSAATVQANGKKYKTTRATLTASARLEAYQTDRDIRQDIVDYLPRYYGDFQQVVEMLKTEASEFTRLRALLLDVLNQFYVETATYGLDRWESITDIEYLEQRSTTSRRHYINAKLRGTGTVTKALLEEIANAFYSMKVNEINNEYVVEFEFLIKRGVPKNLEDIERTINDVIPAHLGIRFKFKYTPWKEYEDAYFYWGELDGKYTWGDMEKVWPAPPVYTWSEIDVIPFSEIESFQFVSIDSDINRNKPTVE
jgi:hypothetical protein